MSVEWKDPGRKKSANKLDLEELRKHPGRWAMVRKYGSGNSAGACRIRWKMMNPEFEFTTRGNELFARFVGDTSK